MNSRPPTFFFKQTRRSLWAPFLLCLLVIGRVDAEPALKHYEFQRPEMGTLFKIELFAPDETSAIQAAEAAFTRVEVLNQACSDYLIDSELIRLCRAGDMVVSDDLFRVLAVAQDIARRTEGAFDITVGHMTNLWRRSKRKGVLPTAEQLAKAKALTGWQMVSLNAATRRVTLTKPGMQLDLGGIAKGYAADEALAVLKQRGITRAVVAASGDLAIGDPPPNQPGWEVSLRTFEAADATDKRIELHLANCGVSTSGDLHQSVEIDGKRYSHVVDPSTGLGLTKRIACSVIAPNATTSDGIDNAMDVLGVEKGSAVLKRFENVHARFVEMNDDGSVHETKTAGFPAR